MTADEIKAGESANVEFKAAKPKDSLKYVKTAVAFANGNGGRIVFGIDDKTREILGVPDESVFREMDSIADAITNGTEPMIIPDMSLQSIEGKTVVIAEIAGGTHRPYYVKSLGSEIGTYVRVSGISKPADRQMASDLYYTSEGRSYDMVPRPDIAISDSDIARMCDELYKSAQANSRNSTIKETKAITTNTLIGWGILAETAQGKICPTNAYLILTGRHSVNQEVQCGVFKGTERDVFLDKRDYDGPLWSQIDEAVKFVLRNIRLGAKIEGIYRKDSYELPPDGIREIVANAVLNCSYISGQHIQVAVFDDRMEVTSPGGLLQGVTVRKMREGFSKIRNRALAQVFLYMGIIEAWGTGIPRLERQMNELGLPRPELYDMDTAFRVTLYRAENNVGNLTESLENDGNLAETPQNGGILAETSKSSNSEKLVYEIMRQDSRLTAKEISVRLGIGERTVERIRNNLKEKGFISKTGRGPGGWSILK